MFLLDISYDIFQNIKLLPFIATILVVFFTYLIATQFCQKRFAGIISVIVLLQSHIFLKFDTIAVKEKLLEFWKEHYQRLNKGCTILKIKCVSEFFLKKIY